MIILKLGGISYYAVCFLRGINTSSVECKMHKSYSRIDNCLFVGNCHIAGY